VRRGAKIENPVLIEKLALSFDQLFSMADFHRRPFLRLRAFKRRRKGIAKKAVEELLLTNPGPAKAVSNRLHNDLHKAKKSKSSAPIFCDAQLRRDLRWAAKRGARVRLVLAGKSDVRSLNSPRSIIIAVC